MKREGDGASPRGRWPLTALYYRPDRRRRPVTRIPTRALRPDDAWCDVVGDRNYNRAVRLPYRVSDEVLWRNDRLYDLVGVLGFNSVPRRQGAGSAIFLHVAREDLSPTAGCVALAPADLDRLLRVAPTLSAIQFGT